LTGVPRLGRRGKGVEITQRERLGGGGGETNREQRPRNRRQESTNWEEGGETKAEQDEKRQGSIGVEHVGGGEMKVVERRMWKREEGTRRGIEVTGEEI
jgi:hypothetical protein